MSSNKGLGIRLEGRVVGKRVLAKVKNILNDCGVENIKMINCGRILVGCGESYNINDENGEQIGCVWVENKKSDKHILLWIPSYSPIINLMNEKYEKR